MSAGEPYGLEDVGEVIPLPGRMPNVEFEYGQLPSTAEFAVRVLATYMRTMVKPPWFTLGGFFIAEAAGVVYSKHYVTPTPVSAAELCVILENLVTLSYTPTIFGQRCRGMAVKLAAELGIIWPEF